MDTECWSERSGDPDFSGILDAVQIVDDLAPISRLEGDIFYRGYVICDLGIEGTPGSKRPAGAKYL